MRGQGSGYSTSCRYFLSGSICICYRHRSYPVETSSSYIFSQLQFVFVIGSDHILLRFQVLTNMISNTEAKAIRRAAKDCIIEECRAAHDGINEEVVLDHDHLKVLHLLLLIRNIMSYMYGYGMKHFLIFWGFNLLWENMFLQASYPV